MEKMKSIDEDFIDRFLERCVYRRMASYADKEAMAALDSDGDGFIDAAEMHKLLLVADDLGDDQKLMCAEELIPSFHKPPKRKKSTTGCRKKLKTSYCLETTKRRSRCLSRRFNNVPRTRRTLSISS